ncbi:carboxymuconolactone decarboxylase family protein [Martelella sp. HB161492]|uniref:carboxymuconolactone decarboxylase family protein n=1 Tax=Martelella sp. HB161492 TaxID=2720726 RepID=UPI0015901303|nr:carboxymuconolactone decarboxylase family protein [Martelella sp. HB161492]
MTDEALFHRLEKALGIAHPALAVVAEMDPPLAAEFTAMAEAIADANALSKKDQALIQIAINATVVHLNADMLRAHIATALAEGATAGEIREVLELTSVLGIHGTIPGMLILSEDEGGLETIRETADPARKASAKAAHAAFEAKRGPLTPAWQTMTYFAPELVTAYAGFSGVPWSTSHLPAKMKELVYIAIDLLPQHVHMEGTRVHVRKAREKGASDAEIISVVRMIALMGVQTHMLALPILKEELEKAGRG